jgi:hypothetical protein
VVAGIEIVGSGVYHDMVSLKEVVCLVCGQEEVKKVLVNVGSVSEEDFVPATLADFVWPDELSEAEKCVKANNDDCKEQEVVMPNRAAEAFK